MKALMALLVTAALPLSAQAQMPRERAMASPVADAATDVVSSSPAACSISSEGGVSSLDFSFGASNTGATSSPMEKGNPIKFGWDVKTTKVRVISTPSSNGGPPIVTAHAINTKWGERSVGAPSLSEVVCADAGTTRGSDRVAAGTAPAMMRITSSQATACRINPGSGVTIFNPPPPPIADKVSVQDFHFVSSSETSRMAGGPGGGPHVKVFECSSADGAPSSVSMRMMTSVQMPFRRAPS